MIKIKEVLEDEVVFTNGWRIFDNYYQDCCELNYAAYKASIKDSILEDMVFDSIEIESDDYGFLLNGHLINCYSEQNGYYSNELDIYLVDENDAIIKKISVCGEMIER